MPIENPFRRRNTDMFPDSFDEDQKRKSNELELRGMNPEFYNLGVEASEMISTTPKQGKLRNPEFFQGQDEDNQTEKEKPTPLSPDQR